MARWVWAASVVVHSVGVVVLGRVAPPEDAPPPVPIEIVEAPPTPDEEKPKEPDPPKPAEEAPVAREKAPPSAKSPTPAQQSPQAGKAGQAAGDGAPVDLGLELGGGGDGFAVRAGGGGGGDAPAPKTGAPPPVKKVEAPPPCEEPATKAKVLSVPAPAYPERAREAGVSGKVRVEVSVDESGKVASARVVSGLGHGLDEAALAAARRASFSAGARCGKPAVTSVTIAVRFDL